MTQVRVYREVKGMTDVLVLPGRAAQLPPVVLRFPNTQAGRDERTSRLVEVLRQSSGERPEGRPG